MVAFKRNIDKVENYNIFCLFLRIWNEIYVGRNYCETTTNNRTYNESAQHNTIN